MSDICQSCGHNEETLTVVRRVWVTPESWETDGKVELGELESWCSTCQAHYPHQVPDEDNSG